MSSVNPKYYLGFFYATPLLPRLHCTHAYFGTLNVREVQSLITEVDTYFKQYGPIRMPKVLFDQAELFEDGVRVLTTRNLDAFKPLHDLRESFLKRGMISSKYGFRPHITTEGLKTIDQRFACYGLMRSGVLMKGWAIHKPLRKDWHL